MNNQDQEHDMPENSETKSLKPNRQKWYYDPRDVIIFCAQLTHVEESMREQIKYIEGKEDKEEAQRNIETVETAQSAIREMAEQQRVMVIAIEKLKNN